MIAAWIGMEPAGVHHDARIIGADHTASVTLPLPPVHPYAQMLLPAGTGAFHLFWLDAPYSDPAAANRLYHARITPDLTVERGPTDISGGLALRYDAAPLSAGGALIVWSGGVIGEPALYATLLDPLGRPRPPERIEIDADYPALVPYGDDRFGLYALSNGQIIHLVLSGATVTARTVIGAGIFLAADDRLESFTASADSRFDYLFWNVTRGSGGQETWYAFGAFTEGSWHAPAKLRMAASDAPPAWAAPLERSTLSGEPFLPVAVQYGSEIGTLNVRGASVEGYTPVIDRVQLISPPRWIEAPNGASLLTWSQPRIDQPAALYITIRSALSAAD